MTSVRRIVLVWMTLLLALVGAAAMLIAYRFARSEVSGLLDSQLRQIAFVAGEGLPEMTGPPAKHDPEDEFVVTIWDATGRKTHASPPNIDIPRRSKLGFGNIPAAGDRWRVYTSTSGSRTVQVAQRISVREELATNAAIGAAAPILVVIPLSWIVIGWTMNRLLQRLDTLARQLAARGIDAEEPIPLTGVPAEVAPLVKAMNALAGRLRHALEQQKRFLSDAAHELRTPLAAIQIQVDGLNACSPATLADRKVSLTQGVRRATGLVGQLLHLARLDDPVPPLGRETVEISHLLLSCVADHFEIAQRKGVDIGIVEQQSATVCGSPDELRTLLSNLIDNAVRYTPPGGTVDVSLRGVGEYGAVIEIVDSGIGIPDGLERRIFDRFFRAAPVDVEGTGLGLAIVRSIADRYGILVDIGNRSDGLRGVRVAVSLKDGQKRHEGVDVG